MPESLRPEGTPVVVGDVVLTTPGLTGTADAYPAGSAGMRGAEEATAALLTALAAAGLDEQLTVRIYDHAELDGRGGTRAAGGDSDLVVDVPAPGDGNGQVLLYAAEDGSLSWHLPDSLTPIETRSRGGERRTYRIPRAIVSSAEATGQRGILGAIGSKLLKVLVFPLIDPILGRVGNAFAGRWESANRPRRLRWFGPDDYQRSDGMPLAPADLARLRPGPALLFLHGTFSTAAGGFGGMPPAAMAELARRYDGRLIALDHHTIAVTPSDNVRWLADHVGSAAGGPLEVDVVTHSRGGLVGRALAERADELGVGGGIRVRNLVMVAPPNAGTALADREHLSALLDRVTNLIQVFPANGVTDALTLVLTIVKQLAVGAFGGLAGIMSMNPAGPSLTDFNSGSPGSSATYRVVTADYEPTPGSPFWNVVRDGGLDLVFARIANDLVVPTDGAFTVPGAAGFPVADPLILPSSAGVTHSGYFGNAQVVDRLLEWLPGS